MLRGLTTVNFFADDVPAAVKWYSELLGIEPYFIRPEEGPAAYVDFYQQAGRDVVSRHPAGADRGLRRRGTACGRNAGLQTRRRDLHGRTPRQVKYIRQIREHDITFGIGPAGTGKTYLAVACAVDALNATRSNASCWHAPR